MSSVTASPALHRVGEVVFQNLKQIQVPLNSEFWDKQDLDDKDSSQTAAGRFSGLDTVCCTVATNMSRDIKASFVVLRRLCFTLQLSLKV